MAGVLLALSAAFAWALGGIMIRVALTHLRPTTGTVISLVSGAVLSMAMALAFHSTTIGGLSLGFLLWFALYGTLNFPMGRFFNYSSIRLLGVSRATPIFSAAPLVSMVLAITLLGEEVTVPLVGGALAVMVGVALIVSEQ